MINFPDSPAVDDEFTEGSTTWVYDGVKWGVGQSGGPQYVLKTGDTMTGPLIGTDATYSGGVVSPTFAINGPDTEWRSVSGNTNGSLRWVMALGDNTAEDGTGNGSDFSLIPHDDAGVAVGIPALTIKRRTSVIQAQQSLTVNGTAADGAASLVVNKTNAPSTVNWLTGKVNGVQRWGIAIGDSVAETGTGNVGSNFGIWRFNDAGAQIDTPVTIRRNTGEIVLGTPRVRGIQWFDDVDIAGYGSIQCTAPSWNFSTAYARSTGVYMTPGGTAWIVFSDARLPYKVSATPVDDTLSKLAGVQLYTNVIS